MSAGIPAATSRPAGEIRKEAEAQAAMMLLESVLQTLIDRAVLTKVEVLESIEAVIETKRGISADGQAVEVENVAAGLLITLANSLMASSSPKRPEGAA